MDQPTGSPAPQDVQATFVATLADEWARGGVRAAVVCPGSRSTPLALALADHPGIAVHVHHDERSGGFLALGLALASGEPVVVLTTSGTATVELHPAVVEAHHAGVPLLVCTADRPPELQDVGAPQTVDQTRLYGTAVRWSADPGVPDLAARGRWRPLAARALAEAIGPPAGPVQLNLPFREPLVGTPAELPAPRPSPGPWAAGRSAGEPASGRPAAGPWTVGGSVGEPAPGLPSGGPWTVGRSATALPPGDPTVVVDVAGRLTGRGLIVAGAGPGPGVLDLAERLGWPVVADPRSGAWVDHPHVVAHLDAVLRSPAARERLRPEVVLRLGGVSSSRVVNEWLAGSGAHHVVVSGTGWTDPDGLAALVVRADPAAVVPALVASAPEGPVASPWLGAWQGAAAAAAGVVAERVDPRSEPGIARSLAAALPAGAQLVVSSSMPIRDVERYAAPRPGLRVLANRGANGIDGVVSTAVGAALAGPPTALLVGDVAFLHDSNGLLGLAGREVDLVVVVVDNDGGGIFSFLPQATKLPGDRFEALFGTPHGLDLVALAAAYGVEARAVGDDVGPAATEALAKGGAHVLVARTDRDANVEAHRVLDEAVAAAVTAALG